MNNTVYSFVADAVRTRILLLRLYFLCYTVVLKNKRLKNENNADFVVDNKQP